MDCQAAVTTALRMLPSGITPVGPIAFDHACVDVTGRGAQLDCFVQAFGLVSMNLSNGGHFLAQLHAGQVGGQVVAPLGGDQADQFPLPVNEAPRTCVRPDSGVALTLRIDPNATPSIWGEKTSGERFEIHIVRDVIGLSRPFPMLLTPPDQRIGGRWFLAYDGMTIRNLPDLAGPPRLAPCGGPDNAMVLEVLQ